MLTALLAVRGVCRGTSYPLAVPSGIRSESLYDNQRPHPDNQRPHPDASRQRTTNSAARHAALPPLSPPDLSFRGDTADFRSMCDDLMDMMTTTPSVKSTTHPSNPE